MTISKNTSPPSKKSSPKQEYLSQYLFLLKNTQDTWWVEALIFPLSD